MKMSYPYAARFTEEEREIIRILITINHSNINSLLRKLVRDQYKREMRKREKEKATVDPQSS